MSIELLTEEKTVTKTKTERTYRTTMETPNGGTYKALIDREVITEVDGIVSKERAEIQTLEVLMTEIVTSTATVYYNDKTESPKTIPISDIPFLMPEAIEILIAKAKAALVLE